MCTRPCFKFFSSFPNNFKYHQNAPFTVIFFSTVLQSTVTMHALDTLFSFICSSKLFQILSERMLQIHFFHFFCSSKSFQIPSECMLQIHCFHFFCSSKSFQIPSECMLQRHRFQFFFDLILCVQNLHTEKRNIFQLGKRYKKLKQFPSKYAIKCPKMQLRRYRISIFSEGACPRKPLNQWCLHIDLSITTPLVFNSNSNKTIILPNLVCDIVSDWMSTMAIMNNVQKSQNYKIVQPITQLTLQYSL